MLIIESQTPTMTSKKELLKYVDEFFIATISEQKRASQDFLEKSLHLVRESAKSGRYSVYIEPESFTIPSCLVKPLFYASFKDCELEWEEASAVDKRTYKAIDNFTYIKGVKVRW